MPNFETTTTSRGNKHDGSDVAAKIHETGEAISEAARRAKDTARTLSDKVTHDVKERSQEMQQNIVDYVRKEPLKAIGGAVVAGMVLSWLLRR